LAHEGPFHGAAARDLEEIYAFLQERSSQAGTTVLRAVQGTIASLAEQPLSGLQTDDPAVRIRLVRRYRYKVFFCAMTSHIEILHVRHPSRGPEWM
jgi:plasmid stabilization system protein ParE